MRLLRLFSETRHLPVVWAPLAVLLIGSAASLWAAPAKKAEAAKEQPDPFVVPDGTPEEIVKYLEKLGQTAPPSQDPKAVEEFSKKVGVTALRAAEKVLAGKPNDEQAAYAASVKLEVLGMLNQLGEKTAFPKLQAFPAELEKLGHPKLARMAGGALLQTRLGRDESSDAAKLKPLLEDIKKFLAAAPLEPEDSSLAVGAALAAERVDRTGLAVTAYQDFAKLFSASKDDRMIRFATKLQGAARRLTLPGKPLELQGVTPDGKPFDWAKYRGKVVLVAFWATWCGPCRVEIGGILKEYAAYHDKGFEVVAVSMDQQREDLVSFLAENNLPWTVLYDQALHTAAADNTMDTRYGIITIPELILVGKDGNVVSLNARGPALGRELAKLLGPAEKPKPKAPEGSSNGKGDK